MRPIDAYNALIERAREEALLSSCAELLEWDEVTYLPASGADYRGQQMAYIAGLAHEKGTDPRVGEWLAIAENSDLAADPDSPTAAVLREMRRLHERWALLPRSLVEEEARITASAQQEWAAALQDSDFSRFRPWLEKVVDLKQREAECLTGNGPHYDALLEDYEPGAKTAQLAQLFATLQPRLVSLLEIIAGSKVRPQVALLHREYPIERQKVFSETVAGAIGFDFERGRLDATVHPFFSTLGPHDCRITTRYNRHNFSDAFFATLHEVGHGLYEQGLDAEHFGTPLGEAASIGMHEGQARLWENLIGRRRAFWEHFYPQARQVFHESLHNASLDSFYRAINHVHAGCNRVQADEVTYHLHILLRFDLEQALLSGDLKVVDLPEAWNAAARRYLGVAPVNDAAGCLQDSHWSSGQFGYFPIYTLGAVYAAQLLAKAEAELGDLDPAMSKGDFTALLDWLRRNLYRHGQRYPASKLIEHITGTPASPEPLLAGLERKYRALYKV